MYNLNYCLACGLEVSSINTKLKSRPPLSKSIIKIHQANRQMNPKLRRFIDQLINQKYKDHA